MHQANSRNALSTDPAMRGGALSDLFGIGRKLLRRVELLIVLALVCTVLIPVTQGAVLDDPVQWIAFGVLLFSMYVVCRSVRIYVTSDRSRVDALERDARLTGATLVARSMRHTVGNKLAITVGYSELLLDDPRLPEDVQQQAQLIFSAAMAAAKTVQKLDPAHLDLNADPELAGPPVLKLTPNELQGGPGAATQAPGPAAFSTPPSPRDADSLEWTHR